MLNLFPYFGKIKVNGLRCLATDAVIVKGSPLPSTTATTRGTSTTTVTPTTTTVPTITLWRRSWIFNRVLRKILPSVNL
ncbi:MAG: hypothetical protein IJU89_02440 [Alphaproteobacteria bacterium]|nr:hypothetical protein [Alphaproteobacteria bacterium]